MVSRDKWAAQHQRVRAQKQRDTLERWQLPSTLGAAARPATLTPACHPSCRRAEDSFVSLVLSWYALSAYIKETEMPWKGRSD